MLNRNYRTVVATVLVGAAVFSRLLCGMTRLETRGIRPSVGAEVVPSAGELAGEFVGSAAVGRVLTHLVWDIDLSGWTEKVDVESLVWVGVAALESVRGVWLGHKAMMSGPPRSAGPTATGENQEGGANSAPTKK
jgi:hypothetical protein